jgi:hypothetical protein
LLYFEYTEWAKESEVRMTSKTAAYWEGWDKEAKRKGRNPLENLSPADLAQRVAFSIARDEARKRVIYARSPGVFSGMDANELGQASSRELALKELKELGINIAEDADPEEMLNMFHLGRDHAMGRDRTPASGGEILGGKPKYIFDPLGTSERGTQEEPHAHDAADGRSWVDKHYAGAGDFVDKYLGSGERSTGEAHDAADSDSLDDKLKKHYGI